MDELSADVEERLAQFLMTSLITREVLWAEITQDVVRTIVPASDHALILPKHPVDEATHGSHQQNQHHYGH